MGIGNKLRESRKTIQPTGNRAEMNQLSPRQWECNISTASETSLSKYPMRDSSDVNPSVRETACIWCQVQWLCTFYSWWKTNQYSQWAQGTRTEAHVSFRVRLIPSLTRLSTMAKFLLTSKGAGGDLRRRQVHPQSVGRLSALPHWSKVRPLPWLMPTCCWEWPLSQWPHHRG